MDGGCVEMVINPYYESRIYIGSVKNTDQKPSFPHGVARIRESVLLESIGKQQEQHKIIIPLRLSRTTFVSGMNYEEDGWEIAAINYPRVCASIEEIDEFMLILGRRLLTEFWQHRVGIVNPKEIIMLTQEEDRYED
jgi:hypothetical protein